MKIILPRPVPERRLWREDRARYLLHKLLHSRHWPDLSHWDVAQTVQVTDLLLTTTPHIRLRRLNHSCCPNTEFHWESESQEEHLRAIRDIREGEELLDCYLDLTLPGRVTRDQRRNILMGGYNFWWSRQVCQCDVLLFCPGAAASSVPGTRQRLLLTTLWGLRPSVSHSIVTSTTSQTLRKVICRVLSVNQNDCLRSEKSFTWNWSTSWRQWTMSSSSPCWRTILRRWER